MLQAYRAHIDERTAQGIPPLPLDAQQTADLVELIKNPPAGEENYLLELLTQHVPAGVDDAAYVKAGFLAAITLGEATAADRQGQRDGDSRNHARWLQHSAADRLPRRRRNRRRGGRSAIHYPAGVRRVSRCGGKVRGRQRSCPTGAGVLGQRGLVYLTPPLAEKITVTVFKVPGETNTDDLSPAQDAWSRPDIPLHANALLKNPREGLTDKPLEKIAELKALGHPLAYVGDVVGTGSSRKSATNSVLWHMGDDIPFIPNKRNGGYCFGSKIAPIFFNTMEDAGALPIEMDVSQMEMGDVIDVYPLEGKVTRHGSDEVIATFELSTNVLQDEVQAGGRIPLIIGRGLTERARKALDLGETDLFEKPEVPEDSGKGYTLAQKMVGKACGLPGVRPGMYCEPKMTTVGSQDTTGPMTRDELKDLACLGFSADLVMQSFCHTAPTRSRWTW